jgi:hypothetical protein
LERVFVLLDLGVQLSNPPWWHGDDAACWYVDLVAAAIAPLADLPAPPAAHHR